jgi:hypothetical protein
MNRERLPPTPNELARVDISQYLAECHWLSELESDKTLWDIWISLHIHLPDTSAIDANNNLQGDPMSELLAFLSNKKYTQVLW